MTTNETHDEPMEVLNTMHPGMENLVPFNQRPKGEHKLISSRGGKSRSMAKSEAAKLRHIRERVMAQIPNVKDAEWLLQKLEDRPSMAAELMLSLERMKQEGVITHPLHKTMLLKTENDIMKTIHGEKLKTENVNINVNTTMEEWEKRIKELVDTEN